MELYPGQEISGTFWRSGEWTPNKGLTAYDIVHFEACEHGNDDIKQQALEAVVSEAIALDMSYDEYLTTIPAKKIIWATLKKKDVERYEGDIFSFPIHKGMVLADDNEGGYLIWIKS